MTATVPLPVRLARSLAVSALAVSAAVLAHVVADGHTPATGTLLVVAGAVTLADLVVSGVARRPWTLVARLLALQLLVHVVLSVAAVAAPARAGSGGHHGTVAGPGASVEVTWAELLPSPPMLLAHLLVAAVVALALLRAHRSWRVPAARHTVVTAVRRLAGAALAGLRSLALGPAPVPALPREVAEPPVAPAARLLHLVRPVVRRGPPALLPA